MFNRISVFAIAAISTAGVATLVPTGAFAMRTFDGSWTVHVTTSRGACTSGAGFGVEIREGVVSSGAGVDVRGNVAANGVTRVRITAGNQSASGSGRLAGNSGAGTWQGVGSQGSCAGRWSATRRA